MPESTPELRNSTSESSVQDSSENFHDSSSDSSEGIASEESESEKMLRNISSEMRKRWMELKSTSQDRMRFKSKEMHVLKMFFLALDRDCDGVVSASDLEDFASETSNRQVEPYDMTLLLAASAEESPTLSPRNQPDNMPEGSAISWGWLDPDTEEFRAYSESDCDKLEEGLRSGKEKISLFQEREDEEVKVDVLLQTPDGDFEEVCHELKTSRRVQRVLPPDVSKTSGRLAGLDFSSFLRLAMKLKRRNVLEEARNDMVEAAASASKML